MSQNKKSNDNGCGREKVAEIAIVTLILPLAVVAIFLGVGGFQLFAPKPLSSETPLTVLFCEWFFFHNVIGNTRLFGDDGDGLLTTLHYIGAADSQ